MIILTTVNFVSQIRKCLIFHIMLAFGKLALYAMFMSRTKHVA